MQKLRTFIATWFGFSRTEVNGFLVLIPLIILLISSEPIYRSWQAKQNRDFSNDQQILDSLVAQWEKQNFRQPVEEKIFVAARFDFDPNHASENDLIKLGFSKNLSKRIANYRQKGGVFRVKRDLMKIYGMDSTLYHQLYANIMLPEIPEENKTKKVSYTERSNTRFAPFDINKADTAQLKKIQGIGNVLATRIVKFRDGLGGFIHASQVGEVYGLDSTVVQRLNKASFIASDFQPKKININTLDEKNLISHPYIKKSFARAILAYRFQHGNFSDVRDLMKIQIIPAPEAERIIPYLKVED